MAVTSSGEIKLIGDVNNEINENTTDTDVSLTTLSTGAGLSAPHGLQEFYGYSAIAAPTVTCQAASSVAGTSMTLNGNVTATGGENVSHGFYIGTNASYASNTKVTVATGQGTGAYTHSATSLSAATTYYINAWASNSGGETVSSQVTQMTSFSASYQLADNRSYIERKDHLGYPMLKTEYYDPSTSSFTEIDYSESTGPIYSYSYDNYFNNVSGYYGINGCRGRRYSGYTGSENWYNIWDNSTANTCYPKMHEATNTITRYTAGSTFNYWYGIQFNGTSDDHRLHVYTNVGGGYDMSGFPSSLNATANGGGTAAVTYSSQAYHVHITHTAAASMTLGGAYNCSLTVEY